MDADLRASRMPLRRVTIPVSTSRNRHDRHRQFNQQTLYPRRFRDHQPRYSPYSTYNRTAGVYEAAFEWLLSNVITRSVSRVGGSFVPCAGGARNQPYMPATIKRWNISSISNFEGDLEKRP